MRMITDVSEDDCALAFNALEIMTHPLYCVVNERGFRDSLLQNAKEGGASLKKLARILGLMHGLVPVLGHIIEVKEHVNALLILRHLISAPGEIKVNKRHDNKPSLATILGYVDVSAEKKVALVTEHNFSIGVRQNALYLLFRSHTPKNHILFADSINIDAFQKASNDSAEKVRLAHSNILEPLNNLRFRLDANVGEERRHKIHFKTYQKLQKAHEADPEAGYKRALEELCIPPLLELYKQAAPLIPGSRGPAPRPHAPPISPPSNTPNKPLDSSGKRPR